MSEATTLLARGRAPYVRLVGAISAAHFVSHYFQLVLAPLLPYVRDAYGVSYTEIGVALAAFNLVSAVLQTPAGFLVDRFGARALLIAGILLGGTAFVIAGLAHAYWMLVAMFAVAGLGNTVYHPADYALLSRHVPARYIGQAYSVHTFAGMLGSAVAPGTLLAMQALWGWRAAFIGTGIIGFAAAALVLAVREDGSAAVPKPAATTDVPDTWALLLSVPVVLNLVFFVLLAMMSIGLSNYAVVALAAAYATPPVTANAALTGNLAMTAIGVLAGGLLVGRTARHGTVAALGLITYAVFTALVAAIDLGHAALIAVMSAGGFFSGVIMPSRDMIVRAVTPQGAFGKVFGFVTTGFNIGGIIAPPAFGAVMDHGSPRLVFALAAAIGLAAVATVVIRPRRKA